MAQSSRCGILSAECDHWLQLQWQGSYIPSNSTAQWIQLLDKTDIEAHGNRDQIIIHEHCALIRALERCDGIRVDVHLPPPSQDFNRSQIWNGQAILFL